MYVSNLEFNDKALLFSVEAYNREKGTNYTVDEMIKEFEKEFEQDENGKKIGNSVIFKDYDAWFSCKGREAADELKLHTTTDLRIQGYTYEQIDAMSIEETEKHIEEYLKKQEEN